MTTNQFVATDEDVNRMTTELFKANRWDDCEIRSLSNAWVRAVMSQPSKKNKDEPRPFVYSKSKISEYLDWRKETSITSKMSRHTIKGGVHDGERVFTDLFGSKNTLYWHGADTEGRPNLWFYADNVSYDNVVVADRMEASALVIQAGLDAMPPHIYNFNFVVFVDRYSLKAMLLPRLTTEFLKLFLKICPDRLKRCCVVTDTMGHLLYKLFLRVGPASFMEKTSEVKSRKKASKMLMDMKIFKDEDEVPTFMGGTLVHDEKITGSLPKMIEEVSAAMESNQSN